MPWLSVSADGQGLCSKKKAVILKAWNKKDQTIMKCQRQKNEQRGYRMIYCVEDERNIRELLVYTLETTGFEAEVFETGMEFDAAMKKSLPELILLDIMLPDVSFIFHTVDHSTSLSVRYTGCFFVSRIFIFSVFSITFFLLLHKPWFSTLLRIARAYESRHFYQPGEGGRPLFQHRRLCNPGA